jgi:DegV family protein with EDD domain
MGTFDVIIDSTSDMPLELRQEYSIDVFEMEFWNGDKKYPASLDWDQISAHDFYTSMRNGVQYRVGPVPEQTLATKLRSHLSADRDVIYIACSSALSNSVKNAYKVRDELKADFPDRKVICIDSLICGMSQGMIAIECAKMRDQGKTIEECEEWVESNKLFFNQCDTFETLSYLKQAGKITASSAFFGNLFAVKPIIISDIKGQNLAVGKVKGRKSSYAEIADRVSKNIVSPEKQTIWIGHADCFSDADELEMELKKKIPQASFKKYVVGCIIGASAGPGTLVVNYRGKSKSEQL